MPLVSDATTGWTDAGALSADEIWQCRKGLVFVSTNASPGADDGVQLTEGEGILIRSGQNVRYRKAGPRAALIARETV